MIGIDDRATVPVLAGQRVLSVLHVKETAEIPAVHRLCEQFVAETQIQRELPSNFPVILHEAAEVKGALPAPIQHRRSLREGWVPKQKIGERQSRAGRVGAGSE